MAIEAPVLQTLPVSTDESMVGHSLIDNIYVNNKIPFQSLEGYEINPLVDDTIRGLGRICLEKVRTTTDRYMGYERKHRLYSIELNDFKHAIEVTDSVIGDPKFIIPTFPGFTESIEGPIRQGLHSHLAYQFDDARIVSIGTNGIGMTGGKYGWRERDQHNLDAMGRQRQALIKALGGYMPVIAMGTSMGSVIEERMARHNLFGDPENGPINLAGQLWLSPALVDPKNIPKDMAIRFIPGMVFDVAKELALKTTPQEMAAIVLRASRYGLHPDDLIPMGGQVLDLLHGTSEQEIKQVVAEIPTAVVAGTKDSLTQSKMMKRLEAAHPDTMRFSEVRGRGHALAMKPGPVCRKLAKESQHIVEQALQNII